MTKVTILAAATALLSTGFAASAAQHLQIGFLAQAQTSGS